MPSSKKAHASVTLLTNEVSQRPHLEQCSLAGKRSGHPAGSIGVADNCRLVTVLVALFIVVVVAAGTALAIEHEEGKPP